MSLTNGPGRRFVLWVQGCCFNCSGCFNKEGKGLFNGHDMSIPEILEHCDFTNIEGITVSGGEPMLQAPELSVLLGECKRRGLNTMVYTGFQFRVLKMNTPEGAKDLLKVTDLLIDGLYNRLIPPDGEWAGSGNQRVIALSSEGIEMKKQRKTDCVEQEYILSSTGELIKTGI